MEKYRFLPEEFALIERAEVPVAVYQFIDHRVVTLALSAGFCRLFGFDDRAEAYDVMDNDMYRDAHPDDRARIGEIAVRFATEGGEYNAIYRSMTADGYHIVHAQGSHVYTKSGVRLAVIWYTDEGAYSRDGAEFESRLNQSFNMALRENSLYHESHFDGLTGLPSMTYFFELADAARAKIRAEGNTPAILYFNLSGMKLFNRAYGFSEGDQLIRAVAEVLARRLGNESCSRFGQDHFTAVAPMTEELERTLRSVFEECAAINEGKTLPLHVGICPGVVGMETARACDRAKAACDALRNSYASCFRYFDESLVADALNRQYVLENLDRVIAEGRIQVDYQSIIRASNGFVCDEEALARWIDTENGLLTPADFVPILEDAGLIHKLDLCVLDTMLAKLKEQRDAGFYLVPTSFNLSRADFDACDIVEEIRRRVDDSGLPRSAIIIELTESVIGSDLDFMKKQIERFRSLGFQVWMDDFGSGYSSLYLLQCIQFDLIKFDLHFMQSFDRSDNSRIVLTELMKMALGLGVETVCEGVETREQARFLREIGCTKLQGFYFTKPYPLPELKERYRQGLSIPFENPEETAYFAAIGSFNIFNPGSISEDSADAERYNQYFDSIPAAVLEVKDEEVTLVRCNQSYRELLPRVFGIEPPEEGIDNTVFDQQPEQDFFSAVRRSRASGDWVSFDRAQPDSGYSVHCFVRCLAENPVTGAVAVADIVLASKAEQEAEQPEYAEGSIEQEMYLVSSNSVARALSNDYICIYYINAETNRFAVYNHSGIYDELGLETRGDDFFRFIRENTSKVLMPEDLDMFLDAFSREKLLAGLNERPTYTLTYRLMFRGIPRYVHMKATRMRDRRHGILIGVSDIDAQMQQKAAYEQARSSSVTYANIARALSQDYVNLFYVNLETERFIEYSSRPAGDELAMERESGDFFAASRRDAQRILYPDDRERFVEAFTKENILRALDARGVFTLTYRHLSADGSPVYHSMKISRMAGDERHIIIGVSNVDAQMKHQEAMERVKEERVTYARITALSGDFIAIYTVDPRTDHYTEYSSTSDYAGLGLAKEGEDFFEAARNNGARTLYLEDLDLYLSVFTKDNILNTIERNGVFSLNYRLMIEGVPTYVNLKIAQIEEKDGPQLIVGVVNIDEQVKRDQKYALDLSIERNRANYDALTGVKNKHAYIDVEARLNRQIEEGETVQFAIVICDVNGLKEVNDTYGHQAGDRFLQRARSIICRIFQNSPVYRVGGDEFAVIIQGQDYDDIDTPLETLAELNRKNEAADDITIAFGMSRYVPGDRSVSAVFERADALMYQNKRGMKGSRD